MVGLDTSHVNGFCKLFNKKKTNDGMKIAFGYPGGSDLCEVSHGRMMKFTMAAAQHGVEIIDDLEALVNKSDAIILTSCDGRQHLEQYKIIAPKGIPVYIDKPFACSVGDAKAIITLSENYNSPVFSASSLRYAKGIQGITQDKDVKIAEAYGPVNLLDDYPGWFWYGVHTAEILFELLGSGVQDVTASSNGNIDFIYSNWSGGKTGISIGYRLDCFHDWGARIWHAKGMVDTVAKTKPSFFDLMVPEVKKFFKTGESPVDNSEMIEIMAYLEAVNTSLETGETIKL